MLFYASLITPHNVKNYHTIVLSVKQFIYTKFYSHKSEWDWVLQGQQGGSR